MNIDEIKRVFNRRGKVIFKLYGMEYTIIKNSNSVSIYPNVYIERIIHYNDLDTLLANYTVFNESIFDCQDDIKNIGWLKILYNLKRERKCTYKEIGNAIGVYETTIYKYFHGDRHIPVDKLILLAKFLNYDIDELLGKV